MNSHTREPVLLTGAGFTYNFGGFLASQMWARIFNHRNVQQHPDLVRLLKQDFDFESVYNGVMYGDDHTAQERDALHLAVQHAYQQLDGAICNCWKPETSCYVSHPGLGKLLENFASAGKERGYIFTLNQDFFVERWHLGHKKLLRTPGMDIRHRSPFNDDRVLPPYTVPHRSEIDAQRDQYEQEDPSHLLYYVKLHGSMNWRTSDGRNVMVIGKEKPTQIGREPLLDWYWEIFEQVFSCPDRRLLVIGYGFGDEHINKVIANAITTHDLALYIICPSAPEEFKQRLCGKNVTHGAILWDGLAGYWDKGLREIYPRNASMTDVAEEIRTALFQ
jgi:hypothetical protein